MSDTGRDIYWHRIKTTIGLFVVWFVLCLSIWILRVPSNIDSSAVTLQTYPAVSTAMWVFVLCILVVPVLLVYFISKDKTALAREFDDVTERHWLTVGVFSLFSYGIYPLWYLFARYRKVDDVSNTWNLSRWVAALIDLIRKLTTGFSRLTQDLAERSKTEGEPSTTADDAPDPGTLHWRAGRTTTKADTAHDDDRYEDAVIRYEDAVETLERAKEAADDGSELATDIDAELETVGEKLQRARHHRAAIEDVREPLQNAASSFQTAVAEHAQNERTPARRDYRQARDQYEQALTFIADREYDLFEREGDITVSLNVEAETLPTKLTGWSNISDRERETLSDAGIGTVSDIRDVGEAKLLDIAEQEVIDDELARRLRAVKWWHSAKNRTFTSRKAIERQRDRAEECYQLLS